MTVRPPLHEDLTVRLCAHDACPEPAIVKVMRPTGWTNLCRGHYERHISREAADFVDGLGLDTRDQQREYIRTCLDRQKAGHGEYRKALGGPIFRLAPPKAKAVPARVPGEDDA